MNTQTEDFSGKPLSFYEWMNIAYKVYRKMREVNEGGHTLNWTAYGITSTELQEILFTYFQAEYGMQLDVQFMRKAEDESFYFHAKFPAGVKHRIEFKPDEKKSLHCAGTDNVDGVVIENFSNLVLK